MKPEEFRKKKEKLEKRLKRQITDEEFEKMLRRQRKIGLIVMSIGLVFGLLVALEWPGPLLGTSNQFARQFASYLGWALVVFCGVSLIWDMLKR